MNLSRFPHLLPFFCLVGSFLVAADLSTFPTLPQPGRIFTFPKDHGSHPDFAIEWWYVTGHLRADDGGRFGFQSTFFRRALSPRGASLTNSDAFFASDEIHLAQMALLDIQTGQFLQEERLNRRGWDASASTSNLHVRNGNWRLQISNPVKENRLDLLTNTLPQTSILLEGSIHSDASWNFILTPRKPLVFFGTNGVSRKAAEPAASSHYLTWPRLNLTGILTLKGKPRNITGIAWLDHEISSSQLGAHQVGWDWTCIQLDDGNELMSYRMRRSDGSTDPFSTLAWIDPQGTVQQWGPEAFQWATEAVWKSPRTGASYPSRVLITAPNPLGGPPRSLRLRPLAADQEISGGLSGIPYWEGACEVLDQTGRVIGRAFLEMTGYAGELRRAL